MGRGHQANVKWDLLVAADGAHRSSLERPQKFGLHLQRHLPDLVEKKGASIRLNEEALAVAARVRERAPHMTEELTLEQVGGYRRAIDGHHRRVAATAAAMDGARGELLPVPVSPVMSAVASVSASRSRSA